jgi:hypothetical protein
LGCCLDGGIEFDAVGDTRGVDGEFGGGLPFWFAEAVGEDAEESVVAAAEEDVSVFSLIGTVGYDGSCYLPTLTFVPSESILGCGDDTHDEQSPTSPDPSPH